MCGVHAGTPDIERINTVAQNLIGEGGSSRVKRAQGCSLRNVGCYHTTESLHNLFTPITFMFFDRFLLENRTTCMLLPYTKNSRHGLTVRHDSCSVSPFKLPT